MLRTIATENWNNNAAKSWVPGSWYGEGQRLDLDSLKRRKEHLVSNTSSSQIEQEEMWFKKGPLNESRKPWAGIFFQNLDNESYSWGKGQRGLRSQALNPKTNWNFRRGWIDVQLEHSREK